MADKQQTALKRLAKKLSALRATLSKDERVLLDRIVLNQEVTPHMISAANTGKALAANKATDVALHSMTTGAANTGKALAANKATEVALHSMTTGAANTGAANAAANLLQFDATTGGYRVTDKAL